MMYTCDISKNLKDGIARLHTEDGKMMLNVYIMRYILLYICGDANIAPIIIFTWYTTKQYTTLKICIREL